MARDSLGELEQLILLAVLRLGDDAYGASVIQELGRHTGRTILDPAVYVALRRLEDKGLLRSRMGEPSARRGGRAKRFFAVEAAGLERLRNARNTLLSLWQGVDSLRDEAR